MIVKKGYIDRQIMSILENHHKGGHKSTMTELLAIQ